MVQMKLYISESRVIIKTVFISHMVQMKLERNQKKKLYTYFLYIPHGSDETMKKKLDIGQLDLLYIPHGSDETRGMCLREQLKIPAFISHMVQMKP
ncbi:hypothetical protein THEYE_A2018 [Thermodesulfovibrio yellowstonii DSM 11347]|uniref:Uncharacterized protein n=1 Tax=Thermodesulfovibrio yellowstonii (strain ATCC 51303 / DSM 11347 / YP87) TaxID=289376 RepID=B5YIT1_THEYD|nr:hypothetical protein THEYE_A2018 [Thermodesulfovibrio yellowstonii DSM 11347]